jgi:hypothetical protein
MKIRIVSDGTCPGTKITNAETGEEVEGVTVIDWHLRGPDWNAECTLKFFGPDVPVDLQAEVPDEPLGAKQVEFKARYHHDIECMTQEQLKAEIIRLRTYPRKPEPV